jgi:hypothetical protein
MKANRWRESSLRRAVLAGTIGLAFVLSNKTASSDSLNLPGEIGKLQAQTDQLTKEIDTLKGKVAVIEQARPYTFRSPPSFHTDASALQISQPTTAWTKRPDGPAVSGVAPTINFELKNIGTKPITDINLIVSFYKPDKEVIGGGTIGLRDSSDGPLRTGMRQKVTIDYHLIQFPETRSAIALNADLYLQTNPGSYALIGAYQVSPGVLP